MYTIQPKIYLLAFLISHSVNLIYANNEIYSIIDVKSNLNFWSLSIYYPNNNKLEKYPAITFIPGFLGGKRHLKDWCEYLASNDIICIAIEPKSIFNFPMKRAEALSSSIDVLMKYNNDKTSPLYQKLNINAIAAGGGSMGGGGAYLASKMNPLIKSLVLAVPWLDDTELENISTWNTPTLFIGGENDKDAPVKKYLDELYKKNSADKIKYILKDTGHEAGFTPYMFDSELGNICLNWLRYTLLGKDKEYISSLAKGSKYYELNINNKVLISGESKDNVNKGMHKMKPIFEGFIESW